MLTKKSVFLGVNILCASIIWMSLREYFHRSENKELKELKELLSSKNSFVDIGCHITILEYVSSTWESIWIKNIAKWKSDESGWPTGCMQLKKTKEYVDFFEKYVSDPHKYLANFNSVYSELPSNNMLQQVFSHHRVYDSCSKQERLIYIEPLVSFLRHPGAVCFSTNQQDKSYLMIPSSSDIVLKGFKKGFKKIFFDVGASIYNAGAGGDSQKWFVDNFRSKGIEFDHIYGWEANPTNPSEHWNTVPPDIKRKSSWFNVPASSEKGHPDNPWTFVREIAKSNDFVVVKIDIDTPLVEVELVKQLLEDPVLLRLVDEFYFEHHVHGSPMQFLGWGDLRGQKVSYPGLEDSYKIFQKLREKGVRAHSWV